MKKNPSLSDCKIEFQKFENQKMIIEEIAKSKVCQPLVFRTGKLFSKFRQNLFIIQFWNKKKIFKRLYK